jgi:hypothetical protein
LSVREVIDLYGKTGHFDVMAITDHILMKRDLLARAGRMASLGYRQLSVTQDVFGAYLDEISSEAVRAKRLYNLWDHRKRVAELVDVWEAANRDDLFSVTSVKHYLMWRTATSTNRSTCTRGKRSCGARRSGSRSPERSGRTSMSR